jgi:hypothetical protein
MLYFEKIGTANFAGSPKDFNHGAHRDHGENLLKASVISVVVFLTALTALAAPEK